MWPHVYDLKGQFVNFSKHSEWLLTVIVLSTGGATQLLHYFDTKTGLTDEFTDLGTISHKPKMRFWVFFLVILSFDVKISTTKFW